MSELIESGSQNRKDLLKHLILQLHAGTAPAQVQRQLVRFLGQVPYGLVVEVEQELMADGLPHEEVTRLCHLHGAALDGAIDLGGARMPPPGHPAHTFREENAALARELAALDEALRAIETLPEDGDVSEPVLAARKRLNPSPTWTSII